MEWVESQLRNLSEVLGGDNPAAALALRKLVSGAIPVVEIREPNRKRHYWQGKVTIAMPQLIHTLGVPILPTSDSALGSVGEDTPESTSSEPTANVLMPSTVEMVIDFRAPAPIDAEADRAKDLSDRGLLNAQIAAKMGCARSRVTELLQYWHASHGLEMMDGRQRHSTIRKNPPATATIESLAQEARILWDAGLADVQISAQLACDLQRVIAGVDHSFRSQGQVLPNHDDRHLALLDRMISLYDQDLSLREIGSQVGLSSRNVTLLLRDRLLQLGRTMLDGRHRVRKSHA